jgi:hypothetical protein
MTINPPTIAELRERIEESAAPEGMDEQTALVWHGYLAALAEGGLISINEHDQLIKMLPVITDLPAVALLTGCPKGA